MKTTVSGNGPTGCKKTIEMEIKPITDQEKKFCKLFVFGGSEFAGRRAICYRKVFGDGDGNISYLSLCVLRRVSVIEYLKQLIDNEQRELETIAVKLQVAETLKAVMDETSTASFIDKFGMDLSPAPLRAVSVNAAKALMEIYPVKNSESANRAEGSSGNIIFNVIVPDGAKISSEIKKE